MVILSAGIAPPITAQAEVCGESVSPAPATPTTAFLNNDPLLGPQDLPTEGSLARLLANYSRFGPMSEADWERTFRTGDPQSPWRWPPTVEGFDVKAGPPWGAPTEKKRTLLVGTHLDRFGWDGGSFLAPAGVPFTDRALPPSSLNTPAGAPVANYHVYCVAKPFDVDAGRIFPWFAQAGNATQFWLRPEYLPEKPDTISVSWLLNNGYLTEKLPR